MLCVVSPTCLCTTIVCSPSLGEGRRKGERRRRRMWEEVGWLTAVGVCMRVHVSVSAGDAQTARGNLMCVPGDV